MENVFIFSKTLVDETNLESRFFKDFEFLEKIIENYKLTCQTCNQELKKSFAEHDQTQFANAIHKLIGSTMIFINNKSKVLELREFESQIREQGLNQITIFKLTEIEVFHQHLVDHLTEIAHKWKSKRNLECVS
jgi:hypothetical protein